MNLFHLENTFGQGSGFIHDHAFGMPCGFQIVAAFYEQADFRCAADSAEEAQRNRNYQSARTRYYEEVQCSVNPVLKQSPGEARRTADNSSADQKRWNECQNHSRSYNCRCVNSRKSCDEVFHLCLLAGRILYQFQNLADRGFAEFLGYLNFQKSAFVDAAAEDLTSRLYIARNRFSGQCRSIQHRSAAQNFSVQRNLFSRLNHDDITDFDLFGINLFRVAAFKL